VSDSERSSIDDIIDVYKRDVDRTLIRQRLTRSIEERLEDLMELQRFAEELRRAGRVTFEADD
jgi:predicted RecB family endonuclease